MARWAMIMSEYNYSVEYIKGATNTAADALSRLIAMPQEAWRSLRLEDRDSDENHPFLLLWPEVHLMCMAVQYDPARTATDDNDMCMIVEVSTKEIEREERLHNPLHDIYSHERVLFSRTTVFTGDIKVLNVNPGLYYHCPDFKICTSIYSTPVPTRLDLQSQPHRCCAVTGHTGVQTPSVPRKMHLTLVNQKLRLNRVNKIITREIVPL